MGRGIVCPLLEHGHAQVWVVADTMWVGDDPTDVAHTLGLLCRSVTTLRVDSAGTQRTERLQREGRCPWGTDLYYDHSVVQYTHFFGDTLAVAFRAQPANPGDHVIAHLYVNSDVGSTRLKTWRYDATGRR